MEVGRPPGFSSPKPAIAGLLQMEADELFTIAEVLQLMHFAELGEGDIRLTETGRHYVDATIDARKKLFAESCLAHVPLIAHIGRVLDERPTHKASYNRFLEELEDHMSDHFAEQTMRAAIGWSRYGEIFAYDDDTSTFSLENPV